MTNSHQKRKILSSSCCPRGVGRSKAVRGGTRKERYSLEQDLTPTNLFVGIRRRRLDSQTSRQTVVVRTQAATTVQSLSALVVLLLAVTMPPTTAWIGPTWQRLAKRPAAAITSRFFSKQHAPHPSGSLSVSKTRKGSSSKWSMMATNSRELRFYGGSLLQEFAKFATTPIGATAASMVGTSTIESAVFGREKAVAGLHRQQQQQQQQATVTKEKVYVSLSRQFSIATNSTFFSTTIQNGFPMKPREGFGPSIQLTDEERSLFNLLRHVREETHLSTTLRVAGGWVRDKLLATPEFQTYHKVFDVGGKRLTSKFHKPAAASMGRQGTKVLINDDEEANQPVDIDIALDDMLGREFADHLNEYLSMHGEDTVSVGVVLKNPEKSKHLETATMKVESFWIDFVNLRAEEYTQDSRIPDLMRIGTAAEDAFRRDLTINALFYNINTGQVEDWTGRGFDDLRKGIVATPLAPLTTLLDDPLRVLRSVRFAARLRFTMDPELTEAALDDRVRTALAQKVSRERVGGEVDLMLRSPDPVGAMRLLVNLRLADTVFPIAKHIKANEDPALPAHHALMKGLDLLSVAHDHLVDCRLSPPLWCLNNNPIYGGTEMRLVEDDEARRLLWYAAFLRPLWEETKLQRSQSPKGRSKKANRSIIYKLLVGDLKRPTRDAEAVERILKASDEFTQLVNAGCDVSATMILLSEVRVTSTSVINGWNGYSSSEEDKHVPSDFVCTMNGRLVESAIEDDPVWVHAMEFRLLCSEVMKRIGSLWRAALLLSISEQLAAVESEGLDYAIEGDVVEESQDEMRQGVMERFDAFAASMQQLGIAGIYNETPLLDGGAMKELLPRIPKGPAFRDVMEEQSIWMVSHPGAPVQALQKHMLQVFPDYAPAADNTR